jgi:hypothetical protein
LALLLLALQQVLGLWSFHYWRSNRLGLRHFYRFFTQVIQVNFTNHGYTRQVAASVRCSCGFGFSTGGGALWPAFFIKTSSFSNSFERLIFEWFVQALGCNNIISSESSRY